MADEETLNSQDFADGIVGSTLDTLANQKDDRGEQDLDGLVKINPQSFSVLNIEWSTVVANLPRYIWALAHNMGTNMTDLGLPTAQQQERRNLVVEVRFETPFDGIPRISFGQHGVEIKSDSTIFSADKSYTPFIVEPYVFSWSFINGGLVEGFQLGVYAITSPPPGIDQHYIHWRCKGSSSRTNQQATEQSWTDSYQFDEPEFLEVDTGDVGDTGDNLLVDA